MRVVLPRLALRRTADIGRETPVDAVELGGHSGSGSLSVVVVGSKRARGKLA